MIHEIYRCSLNLRDLQYLVALAETRHFGRAARKCNVSQPTLSSQLRKLEAFLGVTLIERQPRRIALTEAGKAVVERSAERYLKIIRGDGTYELQ